MRNKIIGITMVLIFAFSAISYAAEHPNPFKGLTEEQIIQKYFEGRQLDIIEGIWLDEGLSPNIIIKTSLVDTSDKFKGSDFLLIEYSSSPKTRVMDGISKTKYPNCYKWGKTTVRLLSPTILHWALRSMNVDMCEFNTFLTRIYPKLEIKQP